jgi:Cytochrome P460
MAQPEQVRESTVAHIDKHLQDDKNLKGGTVKRIALFLVIAAATPGITASLPPATGHADEPASPIYGVTIPPGYRDWKMIAVAQLKTDKVDQIRAQLGNEIAYKEGKVPFPDGAIIVALHWTRVSSEDNNKVLAGPFPSAQSFVVGSPVNMQVMVKDSKKYVATGGWGFGDFRDGKPADEAVHKACFSCHEPAKDRDFVFTRYAP